MLLILDGASEPLSAAPTSLERARTPTLDALATAGTLTRLRTVPAGLPPGSETAIPTLLGWAPTLPVDRGLIEAAAHGVSIAVGTRAWRIDAIDGDGGRANETVAHRAADALQAALPAHAVLRIGGHRLLVTGPPPLPRHLPAGLRRWSEGAALPRVLAPRTVLVAAPGAAAGIGRLMGADVIVAAGATGGPDTDLHAKAATAVTAIAAGAAQLIVHVGAPDEAAHRLDPAGKVAAIERIDRELLTPLARAVRDVGGTLRVCPDHGCDPRTGLHDDRPVPHLTWAPIDNSQNSGLRLTERSVAEMPVSEPGVRAEAA